MLIRLLGATEVGGDRSGSGLGGPQQRSVLGLLVSRLGSSVDQDWIQEQLWPDRASGEMSSTLSPYLTGVRRLLGAEVFPRATGRPARYQLVCERSQVDIHRFEDLGSEALAAADHDPVLAKPLLAEAMRLWRGHPFEDMQETPELSSRSAALELQLQQVRESWASALMASAQHGEALLDLERFLAEDPYHEPFWAMRVEILALMGRRRESRSTLTKARETLGALGPRLSTAAKGLDSTESDPTGAEVPAEPVASPPAATAVDWDRLREVVVGRLSEREPPGMELVGRGEDVDQLRQLIVGVGEGTAAVMVVAGEAGIGKTRLLNEVADSLEAIGGRAHWGRCYDHDRAVPHRPLVNCVRSLIADRSATEIAAMLGPSAQDLAPLLPELADALGVNPSDYSNEERRARLLDGLTEFLRSVAQRAPLALLIDDVQWADEATIALLVHLIHHLGGSTLIAVAYRPEEVTEDHPINRCLAQLPRERPVGRHQLAGLSLEEVATLAKLSTDGSAVGSPDRLAEITGGNPFFVKELARHDPRLEMETGGLPLGVTELIGHRLRLLTDPAREVLRFASVSAEGCRIDALDRLENWTGDPLDSLDECVAAGLVRVSADAGGHVVAPVHALIAEAVRAELNDFRRASMHRRLAEALETLTRSDHERWVNEVAFHWHGAGRSGRPDRAAEMSVEAARLAGQRTAFAEEAVWLERALEVRSWLGDDDAATRAELHIWAANAYHRTGDSGARQYHADEAYRLADTAADGELMAEAALVHGGARGTYGLPSDRTIELLRGALAATGDASAGDEDTARPADRRRLDGIRCRLTSRLAQEEYHLGEFEVARATSETSLRIASSLDEPSAVLAALDGASWVANHPDGLEERERLAETMRSVAEALGDPEELMCALIWKATAQLERGRVDLVRATIAELEAFDELRRIPSLQFRISTLRTTLAMIEGRLLEGMGLAQDTHDYGSAVEPGNADQVLQAQMIMPLREQGLLASVLPMVREMVADYESVPGWAAAYALVLAESGELEEARQHLTRLANGEDVIPFDMAWLQAQAYLAEVAFLVADPAAAEVLRDRLAPFAGRNVSLWDIGSSGAVTHYLGLLEAVLGDRDAAVDLLADAVEFNDRSGQLVAATVSRYQLARITEDQVLVEHVKSVADAHGLLRLATLCDQLGPSDG